MAFLENIGKKVGEAAQAAAKKSSELVEITKLNMNVNSEEDKIQKLYTQIGKIVYEKFSSSGEASPEFKDSCDAIKAHEETIKGLKQKIMEVKNLKACIGCGSELDKNAVFCPKCGTKQDMPQYAAPQQAAQSQVCPSCGTAIQPGTTFCTNCGAKLG